LLLKQASTVLNWHRLGPFGVDRGAVNAAVFIGPPRIGGLLGHVVRVLDTSPILGYQIRAL
jgi:hypothetical protein